MTKELRLILKEYCALKRIPFQKDMEIVYQGKNKATEGMFFIVTGKGITTERYEHAPISLTPYTTYKALTLERTVRVNPSSLSKDTIASWFNNWTNLNMLPTDIGQLMVTSEKVTVVAASNSMRFKHSFSMNYQ